MAVINTILLDSGAEECAYVASAFVLDIIGTGKTQDDALEELIERIKFCFDETKRDPDSVLFSSVGIDKGVAEAMEEILIHPKQYSPKVYNIEGYATLHVYDMVGRGFRTDEVQD
jgi:predicted RNase H-like HicB family nuclease